MTPHPFFQRRLLGAVLLCALFSSHGTWAQSGGLQADRPIRLVVGLAAGGSLDAQARAVAKRMAEISGFGSTSSALE